MNIFKVGEYMSYKKDEEDRFDPEEIFCFSKDKSLLAFDKCDFGIKTVLDGLIWLRENDYKEIETLENYTIYAKV